MNDKTYRRERLSLLKLIGDGDEIRGFAFYQCQLDGPAVLLVAGTTIFAYNRSSGTPENSFWELPEEQEAAVGVIHALDCVFEECYFYRVGFAQQGEILDRIKSTLTYVDYRDPWR